MDANKLKVLRAIGYEIPPTCGLCLHGVFDENRSGVALWGTCAVHTYAHIKHGTVRQLSIFRAGTCPQFVASPSALGELDAFAKLYKGAI